MKKTWLIAAALAAGCALPAAQAPGAGEPALAPAPETPREAIVEELHGERIADPYRWLEDGDSPRVKAWTAAQDARARAYLAALPGRAGFAARLKTLMSAGSLGDPKSRGGRLFFARRSGEQKQAVLYARGPGGDVALVDPNALSSDGSVSLDWWEPSLDGRRVAYGLSEGGSEDSVLRVRDAETGRDLEDAIAGARHCSLAWMPDGRSFYYTRYPSPGQVPAGEERYHRRVFLHRLGQPWSSDSAVWGEGRPKEEWPDVSVSDSGRWLLIDVQQGWSRSELWGADLSARGRPFPIAAGVDARYSGLVAGDTLYMLTSENAPRYRLVAADMRRPARELWRVVVPESRAILEDFQIAKGGIVLQELVDAASRLRVVGPHGQTLREVPLPQEGSVSGLDALPDSPSFHFHFQSFLLPPAIYAGDASSPELTRREAVPTGADLAGFSSRRAVYRSKDGTEVPVHLLSGPGPSGRRPTILTGYGGFNVPLTPSYSPARLAWLERGGAFAVAVLRGGGEFGEPWHRAGMLDKKQNSFDDFLAAAEGLVRDGIASPRSLAILGRSNGGLLVCAALTQRPDLFAAGVAQVPLADMLRYHRSLIARLWIPEYGSPEDAGAFGWLKAYSPYLRAQRAAYPATLLTTGESDTRVDPMHARKMAAQLQWASSSGKPVLLRSEAKAGHGAGMSLDQSVEEWADALAFAARQAGLR